MTVDSAETISSNSPPAPAGAAAPQQPQRHDGGYRDTVESILIAFILAFIFRAFVVEAFVIPTGSMAPTLLGAHARFTCDDCGYQFDYNYSAPGGDDQSIPAEVRPKDFPPPPRDYRDRADYHIDCPSCGHVLHDPDRANKMVPIHYGDRILVLKYAYLFREPERWDVVVFKSPDEPSGGAGWYVTNFIKRLVGRPNETLMVLDGDVYVSAPGDRAPSDFKVQGKPRHVQDALWRIVCDVDFLPTRDPEDRPEPWRPWQVVPGSGAGRWDVGTPEAPRRVYAFDGTATPGASGAIRFDADLNRGRALTDWLAYAQQDSRYNNVSDVKLSFLYHRTAGDGPLRVSLSKMDDTFTAELTPGGAKLFRKRGKPANADDLGEEIAAAPGADALASGGPIHVDFLNVDYGLTLRVGDRDVLTASYAPDVARLMDASAVGRASPKPEVQIAAANQACTVAHLSLWRDVYYTNTTRRPGQGSEDIQWGRPDAPITLGPDEYFVLGDNTVISKDARYWTEPIDLDAEDLHVAPGRVPRRFMLGKAFFVYWPAGYRPVDHPRVPGFIPNFGDMRFIH